MKTFLTVYLIAALIIILNGCSNEKPPERELVDSTKDIIDHARKTVALTFGTLSGELKAAMSTRGIGGAVQYCNTNAIQLTDSIANISSVKIKRATNRPRNPINKLTVQEQSIFDHYQRAIENDLSYSDTLVIFPQKSVYYAPIRINDLCLNCHGNPSNIKDYNLIKSLYPSDKAFGYSAGQLRGIWSISYLNDSTSINKNKWELESKYY